MAFGLKEGSVLSAGSSTTTCVLFDTLAKVPTVATSATCTARIGTATLSATATGVQKEVMAALRAP